MKRNERQAKAKPHAPQADLETGLVVSTHGRHCVVETPDRRRLICHPRGKKSEVVVGDRQPYLCALVTLNPEATTELAKRAGVPDGTIAELSKQQKVREYLMQRIEVDCNAKVARYQTIKKIEVLPHELTTDGGELTATMKLRRAFIADKYAPVIAAFYRDKDKH